MKTMNTIGCLVLVVICLSLVLAALMTSQICHLGALTPSLFHADGQCAATDTPKEVFLSFLLIGSMTFTPLLVLTYFSRFLAKRPKP